MKKKQQVEKLTISCTQAHKASLENLARELGFIWGGKPDLSGLVKAIARGEVQTKGN